MKMSYLLLLVAFSCFSMSSASNLQSKAGIFYSISAIQLQPYTDYDVAPIDEVLEATLKLCENAVPAVIETNHVLIFPENGITSYAAYKDRDLARQLSQVVPLVSDQVNPCLSYNAENPQEKAMLRLSCIASNNKAYVVAHFLEREDCESCEDNLNIYSTAVAFDKNGVVVARYRKFHMYDETALDAAESAQISTFTSDFGVTFGLLMSFDLMFESLAMELTSNVTEILVPFAWAGVMPFLTPIQLMYGWQLIHKVNFIPGCYLKPSEGYSGCGIILQDLSYFLSVHYIDATVSITSSTNITSVEKLQKKYTTKKAPIGDLEYKNDNLLDATSYILPNTTEITEIETCHNLFCCKLTYEITELSQTDMYYQLLAFDGVKTNSNGKGWKTQICGVVACTGEGVDTCVGMPQENSYTNNVKFSKINLSANFDSPGVLPLTMYESFFPVTDVNFQMENNATLSLSADVGEIKNLHTFAMHSYLVEI